MKNLKKLISVLIFGVILLQSSFDPNAVPAASAQGGSVLTQTVSTPYSGSQCAVTQNILVYKGKSLSLIDKFWWDSQYLWIFDPVLTTVYYYNNGVLGGNPWFNWVSTAKFAWTNQNVIVMQSDSQVNIVWNKSNRTTLGGQFTYRLYRKYGFEWAGNATHTEVREGWWSTTKSVKFNPYLNIVNDYECQNIYVAYCGDGIVDNWSQNYYTGDPSNFNSQHLNGNEQCDLWAQNGQPWSTCSATCQNVAPPQATCDSLTVTPIQWNAPLTVSYNCTATNATSYQVNLIQNWNTTTIWTNPTGTYTITQPWYFQIQCVINWNITWPQCTQSVNVNQPQNIDLELIKKHSDWTTANKVYQQWDTVWFQITVTNKGNTTATNFTVKDYLPSHINFVSASNGWTHSNWTVTWTINSLAPNQSITLYVTGTVASASCQAVNKAEVCDYEENWEPQDPDSNPCTMWPNWSPLEDDESQVSFTCQTQPPQNIDLELIKKHSDWTTANKIYQQWDTIWFQITVTNKGNTTATNFTVKDYLPSHVTFVSASNGWTHNNWTVTWNIPSLAPNQSMTLYVTGTVNALSCQAVNKAEVCDYEENWEPQDPDSNPCTMWPNWSPLEDDESQVSFTCAPWQPDPYIDLELDKQFIDGTDGQKTFYFGENIWFKIIVRNVGNTTATNFTVKDYFPVSALQFISASDWWANSPNGTITWQVASLAPWQSRTFYFTWKIISYERSKNKAEVCDYEENWEPQDPDSNPCTMWPDGMPIEDDEDLVMWDVIENPNNNPTCNALTVTPIQWNAPLTVNYNCTATNATSYQVNLIQNWNTTQIWTNPTGAYTITQPWYFQIQCVINWNITWPQCTQSVNVGTWGGGTWSTGNYIDLELDKKFIDGTSNGKTFKSWDTIWFQITVTNKGNTTATNFTVKDYLPSHVTFVSASNGWTHNNWTVTWNIPSLAPNQSMTLYVTGTVNALSCQAVNKAEVCDYEENWEPQDPDSNPCTMWPNSMPSEDDEDMVDFICQWWPVTWDVLCYNLSVTPSNGTWSLTSTISCDWSWWAYEIFVNGNLISNQNLLNYTFSQPGTYTVLCKVWGETSPTCNRTVTVNSTGGTGWTWWEVTPPSCQSLTMTNNGNNNYTFNCLGNNVSTYQINIYKDGISSSNLVHTIWAQQGSYTFTTQGHYVAQCVVNGNITYKLDIYNNKNIDNLTCAYKKRSDSSLCAVKPTLEPYKVNYIPVTEYPSVPTPIEYCTSQEQSSLSCSDHKLSNYGLVKDPNACKVDLDVSTWSTWWSIIDVGIIKSADKYLYTPNEYVTWTLRYTNHSTIAVSNITITDTIPAWLTYVDSSNTPTSINWQVITWALGSSVTLNPWESRTITFRTTFNPISNPNNSSYTQTYTNNVVISTPNDSNPNNNQSSAVVAIQYNPQPFNYCGNRVVEVWEYCDEWPNGGTIRNGQYKGRVCTSTCKLTDPNTDDVPKCADIDPPSINENEYLPYRWNIDLDKVTTATTCNASNEGKIKEDFVCQFKLYNGRDGTSKPIKTWTADCDTNEWFDNKLMSFWTTKFPSTPYGRSTLLIDKNITNGVYGEYKIELSKIVYQVCQNGSWVSSISDDRLCQYNFVVAKPYLIQKWASTTTLQDDSLKGYFWFGSNTKNWEDLLSGVTRSLRLSSFNPTENLSYLLSSFVDKYDKLARWWWGVTYKKVSGKNIYVYENSQTLSDKDIAPNSTIIIKNWDLKLEWTISDQAMYIVPNGTITIWWDANCSYYDTVAKPQIVNGILIAGKWFNSDHYLNNDLTRSRCSNGGLKVNGTMVWANIDYIINKRRTVLDGWFEAGSMAKKTQHIIDWSSLSITPNVNLWNTLPGADEVAQTLWVKKN